MPMVYGVVIPAQDAENTKQELRSTQSLHETLKVHKHESETASLVIPTKIVVPQDVTLDDKCSASYLRGLKIPALTAPGRRVVLINDSTSVSNLPKKNPFVLSVTQGIENLQRSTLDALNIGKDSLQAALVPSFQIYPPMLLLPSQLADNEAWHRLLDHLKHDEADRQIFMKPILNSLHVTHLACDAPIPSMQLTRPDRENAIRSPSRFQPLHGDFGPELVPFPYHQPSQVDFQMAFWVSVVQNGLKQIWAPRYTMFSSGNVSEKTRLLHLHSVKEAVQMATGRRSGCAAVDLFAGIGYFAFSYIKAGVTQVLCWDINPWSIEGLRRGALANGWNPVLVQDWLSVQLGSRLHGPTNDQPEVIIFNESNQMASGRVQARRQDLLPIRHVNCGMLPSASQAWISAIEIIDPTQGGWIHVHESVHNEQRRERIAEIMLELNKSFKKAGRPDHRTGELLLIHVEEVKSVRPRVKHIVLDVAVPPRSFE